MSSQFKDKFDVELLRGADVIVAFSGGKDSTALLHFLHSNEVVKSLIAVHINHGLRKTAVDDERFCREFCDRYHIEFIASKVDITDEAKKRDGIEKSARDFRYRRLLDIKNMLYAERKINFIIATAHTLDDNIETFFINLLRSTSIYTLGGIVDVIGDRGIARPMLKIDSETVLKYLELVGEGYTQDESNDEDRFLRNKIRHKLIPTLKEFDYKNIAKNISKLQSQSRAVDELFFNDMQRFLHDMGKGFISIDKSKFNFLAVEYKRYILGRLFGSCFKVSDNIIDNALELAKSDSSKRIDLPDGYRFEISFNSLMIFHSNHFLDEVVVKKIGIDEIKVGNRHLKFSGALVGEELAISNRRRGDRIDGKKLKDTMIDKKMILFDRDSALVVRTMEGRIIFVEGIYPNDDIKLWNIN